MISSGTMNIFGMASSMTLSVTKVRPGV